MLSTIQKGHVWLGASLMLAFVTLHARPVCAAIYEIGLKVQNAAGAAVVIPIYVYDRDTGAPIASTRSNHPMADGYNVQIDLDGEQAADTVGHMNLNWSSQYVVVFGNGFGSAYLSTGAQDQVNNDDFFQVRPQPGVITHLDGPNKHHFTGYPSATYPPFVVISGPTYVGFKEVGTFVANVTNGVSPVTYQWRYRLNGSGPWSSVVGTAQTYQRTMANIDFELQATCTASGGIGVDTHYVHYRSGPIDPASGVLRIDDVRPNPVRGRLDCAFTTQREGAVQVGVFDARGRRVGVLFEGFLSGGMHHVTWDASAVPVGTYLVRVRGFGLEAVSKVVVSR